MRSLGVEGIFTIIELEEQGQKALCIGLDLRLADRAFDCPISKPCRSYEEFALVVEALQDSCGRLLEKAESFFVSAMRGESLQILPGSPVKEVWSVLSGIEDEELFVKAFNGLEAVKRNEVAEYVLTRCNIFAGRAADFSARFNSDSCLLE
jgi:hypothetical protein